jgi:hypothetical protein
MNRHGRAEYLVLRRTIAQRGALRHVLFVCGSGVWALTATAVLVWQSHPVAGLIPLVVLAATFEAIRPLHFGAERIGRYLQVFFEEAGDPERPLNDTPSWERVAMRFGAVPGVGGHPLFVPAFLLATTVNHFVAMQTTLSVGDHLVIAVLHAAFAAWLLVAHRAMRRQREIELARFRQLHQTPKP